MDHLRRQKYKNKQLKNSILELSNFKPISISVNNMEKFKKKGASKEENIYKNHLVRMVQLVN